MREIILIRHAPVETGGRLIGRTDMPARLPSGPPDPSIAAIIRDCHVKIVSPALRCRQTVEWLCADQAGWRTDTDIQEQDFGDWDGADYATLPDLGALSRAEIAQHRPPNGESFADVVSRVRGSAMMSAMERTVVVAHAGVIRAVVGIALDRPQDGLAFMIDPLSMTTVIAGGGGWAIKQVNIPIQECAVR